MPHGTIAAPTRQELPPAECAKLAAMLALAEASANPAEAERLAMNLARNCGWSCFPCRADKRPACPHGFKDAASAPAGVADLWRRFPGPLIGVATGAASGFDVLDIDAQHDPARAFWWQNRHRLPATRSYRTRSGGMHVLFAHRSGLRCTQSVIATGVDTRADGGYIIFWPAAGLPYLDTSPIVPWPVWLLRALAPKPKPPPSVAPRADHADAAVAALVRLVRDAREPGRNCKLFWAAHRMRERGLGQSAVAALLVPAATDAGLSETEARRTVSSAFGERT